MKYIDIANNIDKSRKNESQIDFNIIAKELNVDLCNQDINAYKLKSYWIGQWCSFDECFGFRMYFFDDIPVCFSFQKGRNTKEIFRWFSKKNACAVKAYLAALIKNKYDIDVNVCDINDKAFAIFSDL